MSAEAILADTLRDLRALNLGGGLESALEGQLRQSDRILLQLCYELALACGHANSIARNRTRTILLQNVLIHLADDIADGDCADIVPAHTLGVTTLYTLQHWYQRELDALKLEDSRSLSNLFMHVGAAQYEELCTQSWTFASALAAAQSLNGLQFQAYFELLADGTEYRSRLAHLGGNYGVINHFANDMHTCDARICSLLPEEQMRIQHHALHIAESLLRCEFAPLARQTRALLPALKRLPSRPQSAHR